MSRDETIEVLRRFFAREGRAFAAVYLFGSIARDDARGGSDVDVGVLRGFPRTGLEQLEVSTQQALEVLLDRKVDLIVLDDAPADLAHRVIRDGVLIAENDASKRVSWEVRSRSSYFDLLPILHRIRRTPAHLQ